MRISTSYAYDKAVAQMQERQQELSEAQSKLASGKRVERASDDPAAAARSERALAAMQRAEASLRAVDASRNAMTLAEHALGDATGLLQSARESLLAAGNGAYSDSERQGIATHLQQLREQLLSIANQQDGAGQYLFAGQGSPGAPFLDRAQPAGVAFQGRPGQMMLASGESLPGSVDGFEAWMSAPTGNGASTVSVFDALDRAIDGLRQASTGGGPGVQQTVSTGLRDVDAVLGRLQSVRGKVGETLRRIDNVEARMDTQKLHAEAERSSAQDLDMVQGILDFQQRQGVYEAVLKSYSQVQKLSLFQFIA